MLGNNKFSLKDRIVFITGATSGIGRACSRYFAEQGAKLLICGRRVDRLETIANDLRKTFKVDVYYFQLDVRNKKMVAETIQGLPKEWQDIDVLLNNAGLAKGFVKLYDGETEDWETMIDTNVKGLLYVTRQILPGMVKRNTGHIINIGSIAGHEVYANGTVYAGTKHAVNAMSRSLRLDLLGTKIRVTTVDPGLVETEFSLVRFKGDTKKAADFYSGLTPLTAEDVADAVLYCATCPLHVNISEVIIMPTDQASISVVNRK